MIDFNNLPAQDKLFYKNDSAVIYCADCREILPLFPEKSFDLVLTDPPYMLPHVQFRPEMREQTRTWGNFSIARMAFDGYFTMLKPLMSDGHEMYWFLDEVSYPVLFPSLYENSYALKLLVWNKGRIGMGGKYRRQFELIIYLSSIPNSVKSGASDILQYVTEKDKEHPFQKPIDLVHDLIKSSQAQTILDPFLGSGTTAVAAKILGRKCVGIEISEEYCAIAAARLIGATIV